MTAKNTHPMVVRPDARAMGAVTALGAPQRVKPRTSAVAAIVPVGGRTGNEVVSYNPRTGAAPMIFQAPSRTRTNVKRQTTATIDRLKRAAIDARLMESMGSIHDGDN